jgi:streptogramin lyase
MRKRVFRKVTSNPRRGETYISRTIVIATVVALGAAVLASMASGSADRVRGNVGVESCAPGSVSATIVGRQTCLKVGQQCRTRLDRQYHRYGFHCHSGTLTRIQPSLPSAGSIVATIPFSPGSGPQGMVYANGAVWVAEHHAETVARIDPNSNQVVARISIPTGQPARFAVGPEGLWHLPYSANALQQLDPATNRVVTQVGSLGEPEENCCFPVVGAGSVWVPKAHDGIYRVDARSHEVVAHIPIDKFFGSAFGFGSLWGTSGGDVFRLDPATNSIAARIAVAGLGRVGLDSGCCLSLGVGAGAVWVGLGKKLARIDPSTNTAVALIGLRGTAEFVAVTENAVWVVGAGPSPRFTTMLWRIDPTTNTVAAALSLGTRSDAGDLTAGAGSLWVTLFDDAKVLRIEPAAT